MPTLTLTGTILKIIGVYPKSTLIISTIDKAYKDSFVVIY